VEQLTLGEWGGHARYGAGTLEVEEGRRQKVGRQWLLIRAVQDEYMHYAANSGGKGGGTGCCGLTPMVESAECNK
jgi:hypothetical protein